MHDHGIGLGWRCGHVPLDGGVQGGGQVAREVVGRGNGSAAGQVMRRRVGHESVALRRQVTVARVRMAVVAVARGAARAVSGAGRERRLVVGRGKGVAMVVLVQTRGRRWRGSWHAHDEAVAGRCRRGWR